MPTEPVSAAWALDEAAGWLRTVEAPSDPSQKLAMAAMGQAWALVSLAASALMPEPEEIADQVVADLDQETVRIREGLANVKVILENGARNGPRHPAIHSALGVLRGLDS